MFVLLQTACGSSTDSTGAGGSVSKGGTSSSGGTTTSNGGTATSNGGAATSNGGTATSNGGTTSGGAAAGGTAPTSGGTGSGGTATSNGGSSGASGGSSSASGGSTSASGGTGGAAACAVGTNSTISNVMKGSVSANTQVHLTGVVATSPKFLLSTGNAGACLRGVFVSEPVTQAAEYSGALVVTTGARATVTNGTVGPCPTASDPIPEGTKVGDVLNIDAAVATYVRSDCATTTVPPPSAEVRLNACKIERSGSGHAVPTPFVVTNIADITNDGSEATHRKWTGVLLQMNNVTGVDVSTLNGPVGSTGTIKYTNGARTRDRIYQPKVAVFAHAMTWTKVVGLLHLDVCQWSLEPRSPCTDFAPSSTACP
ncbi:MAG: hypothetical protein QM756_06425 [Polyangiaceae bacterium]